MNVMELGNIPRFYTALADWLACLLYIFMLRPRLRVRGAKLVAVAIGFLLAQGAFMQLTGSLPVQWFLPCILLSVGLMFCFLLAACKIELCAVGYFCARAFILGELAASLEWQIYYYLYRSGFAGIVWRYLILIAVYALVFGVMYLLERQYRIEARFPLTSHELWSAAGIAGLTYLMSNLSYVYANTPFSGQIPTEIFNIRTMMDLGGVAILYAYHVQFCALEMKIEMEAMENVLHTQYTQYRQSQESIDLINNKYHDLKHQIAVLRAECDPARKNAFLNRMEDEIKSYEAQNKTGNEVLDTVLTGKSLYCQKHDIQLTCVADGASLKFLDIMDLCTLFGNALDNAIEAVEQVKDTEKRLIHLSVASEKSFLRIRVENYYEGDLAFEGKMPLTTKGDSRFHGFGLKSIRQTTEKYGGSLTLHTKDHWFELRILIPIPK